MNEKKILITIPTHNEGLIIGKVISEINTIFKRADILVIDAYSSDETYNQVKKNGANIIQIDKIFGIGLAIETGILFAYENNYDFKKIRVLSKIPEIIWYKIIKKIDQNIL